MDKNETNTQENVKKGRSSKEELKQKIEIKASHYMREKQT